MCSKINLFVSFLQLKCTTVAITDWVPPKCPTSPVLERNYLLRTSGTGTGVFGTAAITERTSITVIAIGHHG